GDDELEEPGNEPLGCGRRQQSGRNFQKIKRGMDDSPVRKDPPEKKNSYANAGFEHVEGGKRINGSSGLTESNHQPRRSVGKLERREQSSDESASCWTKFRRNAWLIPLVYSEFWIAATFSLITAFFPILASSKRIDAWKYGFVFSAYKVAMLIGSLVAERIVAYKSSSFCYILGQGGFVIFTFIFGGLYWIHDGQLLLGLALLFALLGGFTNTLYLVSMFAIVTSKFETHSCLIITAEARTAAVERAAAAAPARQLCSRLGGSEARALAYGSSCGGFESRP
ncbi:hypothetical protein HPB47_021903, partial [Ixodes persulcatus]